MTKYNLITLLSLLVLVAALPVYALFENDRLQDARAALRAQYVAEGVSLYVANCANCHGAAGTGIGLMPGLADPGLAGADAALLYRTIAYSPHGSVMSAWHVGDGGVLSDYQVRGLVALIQEADWSTVAQLAAVRGVVDPTPQPPAPAAVTALYPATTPAGAGSTVALDPSVQAALLSDTVPAGNPHECSACHEEPVVHADRFGLQCARCHGLTAWKPALLTSHTFLLDHGDQGQLACQTCHTENYFTHTCYGCHDHQPDEMRLVHRDEGILEFDDCAQCHPTGRSGEARQLYGTQALLPPAPDAAGADSDFRQFLNSLIRHPGPAGAGGQ